MSDARAQAQPVYQRIAEAFRSEGVGACFALLGDGNMHWANAMAAFDGMRMIYARHEQAAVASAISYARASGNVGVASVTCGPGVTQIGTGLTVAARSRTPLVVFAGEVPLRSGFHMQRADQASYVIACGAKYIQAHCLERMLDSVQEAFVAARLESRPVVLGVPYDLQKRTLPADLSYRTSGEILPEVGRMQPDPGGLARAADLIGSARRVIVLGGRGVTKSGAIQSCIDLADSCGALLATTLPARGIFDSSPYTIGIAGGFSSRLAKEKFGECDLVLLAGASLAHHTSFGNTLFPQATTIQLDTDPRGLNQGEKVADLYLRADARDGADALRRELAGRAVPSADWRTPDLVERAASEHFDGAPEETEPGTLDPRAVSAELSRLLPKDWEHVSGAGHCSFFYSNIRGHGPGKFHAIREFGAIGDGLAYAIGVAVARPDAHIVLTDGDGSLLMHCQELDTVRRHNLRLLICVFNDGAYGAEVHKLRQEGMPEQGTVFGFGDLGRLARGFGLGGDVVTDLGDLPPLVDRFAETGAPQLVDIHISDAVRSPVMRKHAKSAT